MSRTNGIADVDQLRSAFDSLAGCCLGAARPEFNPVRVVASGGDEGGYGPEGSGLVMFENADGQYGILEDWEDSSGHG